MVRHRRGRGANTGKWVALVLGATLLRGTEVQAQTGSMEVASQVLVPPPPVTAVPPIKAGWLHHPPTTAGTLGYGPPGVYPGFQGFGLGYHLGYGYGGYALGPGLFGGYPFYGGPGYPCGMVPQLRRLGPIVPFPYNGSPGYPTPEHPNYYGQFGPLVPDRPVVTVISDRGEEVTGTGYGDFTGAVANPEALFAPFTARAAAGVSSMRARSTNPVLGSPPLPVPAQGNRSTAGSTGYLPRPAPVTFWASRPSLLPRLMGQKA